MSTQPEQKSTKPDDPESFEDQLSRLNLIATGERDCDLSDNDAAALKALLRSHRDLLDAMKAVYQSLDQQMLVKPNGWYTAAWICAASAIKKAGGR